MVTFIRYVRLIIFYSFLPFVSIISWYNQPDKGPHGGIVKKADNYFIEMKIGDKYIYAYLLDTQLNVIDNKDILSGDVKFFLTDSTTFFMRLKPVEGNAFANENINGHYCCIINFKRKSQNISATFDTRKLIVQKN